MDVFILLWFLILFSPARAVWLAFSSPELQGVVSQPREGTCCVPGLSAVPLLVEAFPPLTCGFPGAAPAHLHPSARLHSLLFASDCLVGEKSLM